MSDQTYLNVFVEEGREHVQRMNTLLLDLENDPENKEPVQELFRSAHTLKGMSATMGFEAMADLTHELENVLQQVRDGVHPLKDETMDILFQGVDRLEMMVEQAANGEPLADVSDLLSKLRGGEEEKTAVTQQDVSFDGYERELFETSLDNGYYVFLVKVTLSEQCVLKGARAYMVYEALEKTGDVAKAVPSVEDLEEEKFDRTFHFVTITKEEEQHVKRSLEQISELESVDVTALSRDALKQKQGVTAKGDVTAKTVRSAPAHKAKATKSIRVDIERLDALMNLFSEWVIDRGRIEQIAGELNRADLTEVVEHMNRIGSELQETILNLRMVPVEQVFNRFPRMVRDLAKELNKNVQLEITGADTELDRTVIDEIGDPLVHLLRNALDHGLETPEERREKGKPETGHISLRAFYSGNHAFIEIADDGAGISRDKVLQKALKNGIIDRESADKLSDAQVYDLLFASGFSTAEQVTDVSGRGVGLDVVRTKIESLGGSVSVQSEEGKGTTFSIQLPLTLSILTALLVRTGDETYAIPINSILETGKFDRSEIQKVHGQPVLRFRERIVPLVPLHEVFSVPQRDSGVHNDSVFVVIVKKGDQLTGLVVDELLGQQEVVLKSLGNYLNQVFAISGATILGDGRVALIVDTNALIQQQEAMAV